MRTWCVVWRCVAFISRRLFMWWTALENGLYSFCANCLGHREGDSDCWSRTSPHCCVSSSCAQIQINGSVRCLMETRTPPGRGGGGDGTEWWPDENNMNGDFADAIECTQLNAQVFENTFYSRSQSIGSIPGCTLKKFKVRSNWKIVHVLILKLVKMQ